MTVKPLQDSIVSALRNFSSPEGEKKLMIAALWEKVAGKYAHGTQIVQLKNQILFVGVKDHLLAQELKVRFQRKFVEEYGMKFGEKLKDMRFILIR